MRKALSLALMSLGGLLLASVLAAVALLATGRPSRANLEAAVKALKGQAPASSSPAGEAAEGKPAPVAAEKDLPDFALLKAARERLGEDQEQFRQEKAMAHAQLEAERAEVERLRTEVAQRVDAARQPPPAPPGASGVSTMPAAAPAKGVKALAEIAAKMTPKAASQLFLKESEEDVAGVLQRMDPKQAAKILSEMVSADADRAQRVAAILREGKKS